MASCNNGGSLPSKSAADNQISSLTKLHGNASQRNKLIGLAEQLAVDMKARLPESGIKFGVWHQLPGKTCNGVLSTSILVSDTNATFIDLCTGVVVTVDHVGRRSASMIGGAR